MIRSSFGILGLLVFFGVLFAASPAAAQGDQALMQDGHGMEAHMFRSAVDTKGHFTVDATPILPHLAISLGLMLDFGFNNWIAVEQLNNPDGLEVYRRTKVDTYINSVLMFNVGLWDMLAVGIQVPLVIPSGTGYDLSMDADQQPTIMQTSAWSTDGGIGDIGIHAKARWLRADRHFVGIGTVLQYHIPSSQKSEWLMSESGAGTLTAKLIIDFEPAEWYRFAINAGVRVPLGTESEHSIKPGDPSDDDYPDNDNGFGTDTDPSSRVLFKYGPMMSFGLGNSFTIWPEVLDFVVEGYGYQLMSEFGNMAYMSMEVDAGFKLFIERNSYLLAGYAHGLPISGTDSMYGVLANEHRMFIGFSFEPSVGDRDGDGLKDDVDHCPNDPEDFDNFEDTDGCPEPDNDRDGIPDKADDCPLVPEDQDGDQDEDGCPERGVNDRDGDGIVDELDQCPDDPEDKDDFEDKDGCPDPDNDKDGLLDRDDLCPNDPEDMDGFEDKNGCPDPDNDADRILDVDDDCPLEPETYNGKDDQDGCPDKGDVVLTDTDIYILKKVYFEYDSATIKSVSFPILDAVATTIRNNPQITSIEVQGHADERGAEKYNQDLTADRAAAVVDYLVDQGVSRGNLMSAGYGEYCPVDDGHNEAAWEKNRRVEFKVLSINGNLTGVETACPLARRKGIRAE